MILGFLVEFVVMNLIGKVVKDNEIEKNILGYERGGWRIGYSGTNVII